MEHEPANQSESDMDVEPTTGPEFSPIDEENGKTISLFSLGLVFDQNRQKSLSKTNFCKLLFFNEILFYLLVLMKLLTRH